MGLCRRSVLTALPSLLASPRPRRRARPRRRTDRQGSGPPPLAFPQPSPGRGRLASDRQRGEQRQGKRQGVVSARSLPLVLSPLPPGCQPRLACDGFGQASVAA